MKVGLLWFDDDPRAGLEEKVRRAAAYYERKYGQLPDLCFVHRSVFSDKKHKLINAGGVAVRLGRNVLPDHFWLGREDDGDDSKPEK